MDKHYDALSAARSERSVQTYTKRVEQLASGDNRDLRREQNILRDKISRLQQRITSTEENMERFTGKGAESIREQAEKTLKNYRREIDEIKAKLKMLRGLQRRKLSLIWGWCGSSRTLSIPGFESNPSSSKDCTQHVLTLRLS